MRLLLLLFIAFCLTDCKTNKPSATRWIVKSFNLFTTNDTINLNVTYFVKNSALCYNEGGVPYALLIGQTNNPISSHIPKTITVLAKCNNNDYKIGQNVKVVAIEDSMIQTISPIYVTTDTLINKQKYHWLVGSENPAMWGRIL